MWVTGLPASGKSTISRLVKAKLSEEGVSAQILETDELRLILTPNPTYNPEEREVFYTSLAYMGWLLTVNGVNVIFDATANRRRWRDYARARIPRFIEVYMDCPLKICEARDPKGIYTQAATGQARFVPGAQQEYEKPLAPEITLDCMEDPKKLTDQLMEEIRRRGLI
ncbi:MAG: adenylyl-sulfate kinase [Candidatus Bathyarchaeia archaeon]